MAPPPIPMERRASAASAYYSMSSSLASSPSRSTRVHYEESRSQSARSTEGSSVSPKEELLASEGGLDRARAYSQRSHRSAPAADGGPSSPSRSLGPHDKAPRRPSGSPRKEVNDISRSQEHWGLQPTDERLHVRQQRDESRLGPPAMLAGRDAGSGQGMPRSVSGPTSVGRSKVERLVGGFEAASSSSKGAPDAALQQALEFGSAGSAGLPRSRSASSGAKKGSSRAAPPSSSTPGPRAASASGSPSPTIAGSGPSSASATAKSAPAQPKPSLRARLFGFKSSSSSRSSADVGHAATPASSGPSLAVGTGAPAAGPSFARPGGLLSPTPSSHEFHSSDWSDTASIAHSVRSESHAASAAAAPRRSASVNSVAGRPHTRGGTPVEHGSAMGGSSSSLARLAGPRAAAAPLRQKVSSSSLRKSVRSPSPSPSVSTMASSIRHARSDTGDSGYRQAVGRRGATYTRPLNGDLAATSNDASTASNFDLGPSSTTRAEVVEPGFVRPTPMLAPAAAPLQHEIGLREARRPSVQSSIDGDSLSSQSSTNASFPTDHSFLVMPAASAHRKAASGSSVTAEESAPPDSAIVGSRRVRDASESLAVSERRRSAALRTASPLPPPSRTPPPVPIDAPEGERNADAQSSSATLLSAAEEQHASSSSPQTPSGSARGSGTAALDLQDSHGDDRSITPTAPFAPPPTKRSLGTKTGEALAAITNMEVQHGRADDNATHEVPGLGPAGSLSRAHRRREQSQDGTLSRQPSNASSHDSSFAGNLTGRSAYMPRSSSLHGHGAEGSPLSHVARPSANRGSSHGPIHGPHPFASPLQSSASASSRGLSSAPPQILPRTTSSSAISSSGRPESSHGSPRSPSGFARQQMRMSRPRTAESSQHAHSNSISSAYENQLLSSPIAEETPTGSPANGSRGGSKPGTPLLENVQGLWKEWHASIGSSPLSPGRHVSSPVVGGSAVGAGASADHLRPGLPPKNPLRSQRSPSLLPRPGSSRSVSDPVHGGGSGGEVGAGSGGEGEGAAQLRHPFAFASPGLAAETSESLLSAWQTRQPEGLGSPDAVGHSELTVLPWIDSPASTQPGRSAIDIVDEEDVPAGVGVGDVAGNHRDADSERQAQLHRPPMVQFAEQRRQPTNLGIGLGEDAGIPKSLSASALSALSPHDAPWAAEDGSDRGRGDGRGVTLIDDPVGSRLDRDAGGMAHSSSKRSKLTLGSSFRTGRSRSKTVDASNEASEAASAVGATPGNEKRKKEGGTGSKIWSFARDLGGGDHDPDVAAAPNTLRKSKGTKKAKGEAVRPQIRRVFDDEVVAQHVQSLGDGALDTLVNGRLGSPAVVDGLPASSGDARAAASAAAAAAAAVAIHGVPAGPASPSPSVGASLATKPRPWIIDREHLDDEQKRVVKRWYVLRELLETERSYASDLAVARDVYLARARTLAGIVVASQASPFGLSSSGFFQPVTASPAPSRPQSQHQALPQSQQQRLPQSLGQPPTIMQPNPQSPAKHLLRHVSADSNPHSLGGTTAMTHTSTSPASFASSNPSNRSSTYTVSSLSSQTSDGAAHPLPPLPSSVGGIRAGGPPLSPGPTSGALARQPVNGAKAVAATAIVAAAAGAAPPMSRLANHSSASLGSSSAPSTASTPTSFLPGYPGGSFSAGPGTPDAPFSAADVRIIFAQLEQCAALADEMTAVLEAAVGSRCTVTAEEANAALAKEGVRERDEDDRVGGAFLRLMPRIDQVYAAYCSRHEASMSRLQELLSSEPKVSAFLRDCTAVARRHTNAWDLSSLLIKPVQRVLKYPLLIHELLANTSEEHPDHAELRASLVEIQKVADHINEVKKRKDLVDQIVAGKAARRTASQKVQHGTIKKIKRQQEKIRTAVVGPPPDIIAEDEQTYRSLVEQLLRLEAGLEALPRQCLDWSESLRQCYVAQVGLLERWRQVYLLDDDASDSAAAGVDERLVALLSILRDRLVDEAWQQLDAEIRSSIVPMAERLARMFSNPKSVVAKRNDREPDYTRYRNEMLKAGAKAPDRKLAESAGAFVALHTQLMDELPQFNYGVQSLVDICVESLARLQAAHHMRVQRALVDFWRNFAWADREEEIRPDPQTQQPSMRHLNPVKMFWEVHSGIAAYAENLQITRRRHEAEPSNASAAGFSPLQLRTDLPKPEFTPPTVANPTYSMTPLLEQLPVAKRGDATGSRGSFMTASGSREPTPYSSPAIGSTSPKLNGTEQGLGSPVQISSVLGADAGVGGGRGSGGSGVGGAGSGAFGSLGMNWGRGSVSSHPSRPASSNDSMVSPRMGLTRLHLEDHGAATGPSAAKPSEDDADDAASSKPPTPISKDTPLRSFFKRDLVEERSAEASKRTSVPVLPALTFSGSETLFGTGADDSRDASFLERIPERASSISEDNADELRSTNTHSAPSLRTLAHSQRSSFSVAGGGAFTPPTGEPNISYAAEASTASASSSASTVASRLTDILSSQHQVVATMAAVADSPGRSHEAQASSVYGYPLLEYATGDLFRVLYIDSEDRRYYFGKTERGELGWAERAAFVPLV
ncbi:uncharacterized protein PFL1_05785 [Pseudozyma flocculosa PF-1]|nr:uncharacterized protein PFL1_05785 [Pseudozyma flocculosa PF-1]EPQ26807.1 hypothetical protein PFL1_05785 [Pseudozyma flocculosa PF-1]